MIGRVSGSVFFWRGKEKYMAGKKTGNGASDTNDSDFTHTRDAGLASLAADLPAQLDAKDRKLRIERANDCRRHPEKLLSWEQVKSSLAEERARRAS
jgi:hypothetical protein